MRRIIAILAAGLVLIISFSAAGSARADTTEGCNVITGIGNEEQAGVTGGGDLTIGDGPAGWFCNVSIPINGQFEIENSNTTGCESVNTASLGITEESSTGCAINNGAGYAWDRWTAISISYHSNQLWMFKNASDNECMDAVDPDSQVTYATCDTSNHYEWFSWPDSGL